MSAEAAATVVQPVAKCGIFVFDRLKGRYDYAKHLEKNFIKLEEEERSLQNRETDVRNMLVGTGGRMDFTAECRQWFTLVDRKKDEIEALRIRHQSIKRSLGGLYPFPSRHKLGRDIVKETERTVALRHQRNLENVNSIMTEIQPARPQPDRYIRKHAKVIPTLDENVKKLQKKLKKDKYKRICIWGSPGVGKTTLMEILHDKVLTQTTDFDLIFWVTMTLTEEGCVGEIQKVLEERLSLEVRENSSKEIRAANISSELEKYQSYLLFLDQFSSDIDLKKVGIHDDHNCGKVVFACNYRYNGDMCRSKYDEIELHGMSVDDAQKFFRTIVDPNVIKINGINRIATLLVKLCGGIPQLIKVIALHLANEEHPAVWQDTLTQLQSHSTEPSQPLEDFHKIFKLPYDKLDERKKACLLYWAIFPVGYEIHRDYIIECWRAEQFFTDCRYLWETRNRGHAILTEFVSRCLLSARGRKGPHYKMFEHFHSVARRIVGQSLRLLVEEEGERINKEEWRHADRVSLIGHRLSTLPEMPECSKILTLLLQENHSLVTIPESFFTPMEKLQVLDLHDTKFKLLPSSISSLKNLKALFLNDCRELKELPTEIGELQSLEILDLSRSGILCFLNEIKKLTNHRPNLKCLRVSFDQNIASNHNHVGGDQTREIIPHDIFSKLASLEELSIGVDDDNTAWNNIVDAIVEKVVVGLEELTTLRFYFPKVNCLNTFISESVSWKREKRRSGNGFRSFNIVVGYHQTNNSSGFDISECSVEKHLKFSAGQDIPDAILQVLEEAWTFELIGHKNVKNLSEFGATKLGELEMCKVEECNEMESIIDGDSIAFKRLKKLLIINIPKLVHLWYGSMEPDSLSMLTTLILKVCPRLKHLFSKAQGLMVQQLPLLQRLEVEDCKEMEEIIETGSVVQPRALPKLKVILLRKLPKLLTIGKQGASVQQGVSMEWPSLEKIEIESCEMLKDLLSTMEKAVKLRQIKCTSDWKNGLIWPNGVVDPRFQSLFLH